MGFLRGDGRLNVYMINWSCGNDRITNHDIGAILV